MTKIKTCVTQVSDVKKSRHKKCRWKYKTLKNSASIDQPEKIQEL